MPVHQLPFQELTSSSLWFRIQTPHWYVGTYVYSLNPAV